MILIEALISYIKVDAEYRKTKNKFKDASEIVKAADVVDDGIAEQVEYIDKKNLKKKKFKNK